MSNQYRTKTGDVLDAICYKHYEGRPGATEAVLAANPGLAGFGPVLPSGLIVDLPLLPALDSAQSVRLWD